MRWQQIVKKCDHPGCFLCDQEDHAHFEVLEKIEEKVRVATVWAKVAVTMITFFVTLGSLYATL